MQDAASAHTSSEDERLIAFATEVTSLRDDNASLRGELARAHGALASLRARYHQLLEELHLLKRRLTVAKAERLDDVEAAQLAFDKLLDEAQAIEKVLETAQTGDQEDTSETTQDEPRTRSKKKPTGRRDMSKCDLPEVRIELGDPELEGKAERIGVQESSRVVYERGGYRRLVTARIVYKNVVQPETRKTDVASQGRSTAAPEPEVRIVVAPMPKEIVPRGILAPSAIGHILAMKYVLGVPFHRQEQPRSEGLHSVALGRIDLGPAG